MKKKIKNKEKRKKSLQSVSETKISKEKTMLQKVAKRNGKVNGEIKAISLGHPNSAHAHLHEHLQL